MESVEKLLLQSNTVFSIQDAGFIWDISNRDTLKRRIVRLADRNKIQRLKRGLFYLVDRGYSKFELANKLKSPSYISLETVLAKEGITFQVYESIFSIADNSKMYLADNTKYIYRKMKNEILLNPLGIVKEKDYFIATKERAVLDTLYFNKSYYFDNLSNFDFEKALEIAKIYNNNTLTKTLIKLKKDYA